MADKEINADEKAKNILGEISFKISIITYQHLENVEFDVDEQNFLDNVYKNIDSVVRTQNINELIQIYEFLNGDYGESPFNNRFYEWEKRKNKKILEEHEKWEM